MYEAITIIKILMQVPQPQIAKSINTTMYYYCPSPAINDTIYYLYYLKNHMCHLEKIPELIKVSTSLEHQSARTYPRK